MPAASSTDQSALAEEQAALRRVATLVARGVPPAEIFSAVSEEVGRLFGSEAAIARFEPAGSAMVVVALTAGITVVSIGDCWELKDFLASTAVYRTGRPARYDHTNLEHALGPIADSLREMGVVSSVAAPIRVGGHLWGVITASDTHNALPQGAEERLESFTELVSTAIVNAESRAELAASEAHARELADEQAALRRVATLVAQGTRPDEVFMAVAREVAGVIKIPNVGVNRYDPDGMMTILAVANDTRPWVGTTWPVVGVAEMVLATGRPARQDDFTSIPGPLDDPLMEELRLSAEEPRGVVGVPIVVDGTVWGFMAATTEPGEAIPAGAEKRLARFTELVATAVSNATTRTELLTSRARLVSAADETRRRLERDLHDGIQQRLVTLMLEASKAAAATTSDPRGELSRIADDLVAVIDELREISRGIHPAILTDAGLDAALKALARRSAVRVVLDVNFEGRYEPTLEATVYYVVAESITNAAKHADASVVTVRGGLRGEKIELEIEDDGVGGADPRRGSGIIGLTDRVDSLRGTILISSPAGAGTTIRVTLPIGPTDESAPLVGLRADAASIAPNSG